MKRAMVVLVLACVCGSASAAVTSWTFDSDVQGWKIDGSASAATWNGGWIQNQFAWRDGTVYVDGLNIPVLSANDTISLDSRLETVAEWCSWWDWNVIVTTDVGSYTGSIAPSGNGLAVWALDKSFNLVTDLGIDVGETITAITVNSHSNGQHSMYVDNVVVSTVPEPATMALLSMGGLLTLRRRMMK